MKFKTICEEITASLSDSPLPKIKSSIPTNIGKRNANNQNKVAGKYKKGFDNVTDSMITQRDREANQEKGQLNQKLDNSPQNRTIVLSRNKFDELMNQSGGRTLNLDDMEPKSLNSKTAHYTAQLLPDGRVTITRLKQKVSN